jgi:hypothetical protein
MLFFSCVRQTGIITAGIKDLPHSTTEERKQLKLKTRQANYAIMLLSTSHKFFN